MTDARLSGAVRTGQPYRTLLGHTAPVTSLQFDELHIITGSLDKSIRVRPLPLRWCYDAPPGGHANVLRA